MPSLLRIDLPSLATTPSSAVVGHTYPFKEPKTINGLSTSKSRALCALVATFISSSNGSDAILPHIDLSQKIQ